MVYSEARQHHCQCHCHLKSLGNSTWLHPESILRYQFQIQYQITSLLTWTPTLQYPYNKVQVHLQGLQSPIQKDRCLVFEPLVVCTPQKPHWSSSSSNSLSSFLPQDLYMCWSLCPQIIMRQTPQNPGPVSNINFSEKPSLTSHSNIASPIISYP